MKIWPILNKFVLIAGLLFASQVFADETIEKWTDVAVEPQVENIGGKDYRMIYTANELAWISLNTKGGGSSYNVKLMNDIDLAGKLWLPICAGNHGTGWAGIFDGNGHSIRNLYIRGADIITAYNNYSYAQNIGFIAVFTNGTIKNLALEDVDIYATNNKTSAFGGGDEISVGTLIAYKTPDGGLVDGILTSGSINVSGNKQGVGGIVGNAHSSTIKNCYSSVNVYTSGNEAFVGGIVGLVKNKTVQITSCVYAGETLLNTGEGGSVGAIVGKVYKGSAKASTTNVFYDSDQFGSGIGLIDPETGHVAGTITPVSDLNSEEVVCKLNGGTWSAGACSGETSSVWAVGISGVSLNGSDGFKITFNANGGTFPVGAKTSKTLLLGKTIIADEIGIPTNEGLSFAGWSLDKNAVDPDENLGTVDGPDTVYAVWYPYFDVTFASTSGVLNGTTIVKKIAKNDNVNINDIAFPDPYERCDETDGNGACLKTTTLYFTGWTQKVLDNPDSYIIGDGVSYADTIHVEDIKVTGDITIYSVWTTVPTYTVTYDANGHGRTWVDYVQVEEGQSVTTPEDPVADPGYEFAGWYTEPECKNEFDDGTGIYKNETLYAKWGKEPYSITYDLDKGTNNEDNPTSYNVETPTIVFQKPTRDGHSFGGWFYDSDYTMRATQITQGTTGDKTLHAKWEINTYSIVYMSGVYVEGTSVADEKEWDETVTLKGVVDEFYREGYVQDGWSVVDGGDLTYKVSATYSENHDLVLYPHWIERCDTVNKYGAVVVCACAISGRVEAVIDGSSMDEIDIPEGEGFGVDTVIYNRTFEAGKHSTIILPFSISVDDVDGATFYELAQVTKQDGKWKDVEVYAVESGTLTANTPYIVTTTGSTVTFKAPVSFVSTQTLDTARVNYEDGSRWEFMGTYQKIVFGDLPEIGRAYGFAAEEKDGAHIGNFVKAGPRAWMRPMRAYLVYEPAAENSTGKMASMFDIPEEMEVLVRNEKDEVVERGVLDTRTGEIRMDSWYDLQGRKLNRKPQTQGTYYHNGSRVIVK